MAASSSGSSSQDHALQIIKKYRTYVGMILEGNIPEESKLKAAQEISENFEVIIVSPHYSTFLEYAIPRFLQFLRDGEPQFVAEGVIQQLRKLILEIIHRIPTNDHLRPHYKNILTAMFHLLELENEENVLVCLRIIIELHRQFRPPMQPEIQQFLHFVKNIYKDLPYNIKSSFEVVPITATGYLPAEVNGGSSVSASVSGAGTSTTQNTKSSGDLTMAAKGGQQQTVIPKAVTSLKVLAELPIIVVLLFQLYKQNVLGEIREFIPLIMKTIVLQPSMQARNAPSFNKEVYVDFVAAQIKTLSFLAFIIRAYQEYVNNFSTNMVGGMLGLFRYCPQEVAHLRKELLIAARHILVTDLRNRFVPHIDQLFDEDVLIGTGWTARESLRPLAYSTLADLVHHVRTHLPLQHLSLAVHLFSKNVHDESLPVSIQTMSCKLLLNLVEGIRKSDEQGAGREILMRMLEVFVRKFHSIAMHELPLIMGKCENKEESSETNSKEQPVTEARTQTQTQTKAQLPSFIQESESSSKKPGESKSTTFSAADCKSMVKTLVCGVKTITWGAGSCRDVGAANQPPSAEKVFLPQETPSFSRLLKYALQALDIYQIVASPNGTYYIRTPNSQQVRMKEEKEILEHFAGVFTMLNTSTFKEVFQENIEYLVERIHANFALQIIPNSFLANPHTSATFATILMQFLLNKLDEMGTNVENSNLYLKLFKLVFGSVSLFASENEQMLKPHLHEVVNRSMELACTSKEPYNYFLLLRALFRSIGGGNHDLLYQEFLPLLPNLLQGLNNLQSGVHRQYMKDLFVELCLTVPVRLSSLLPYLPMLMDPLVSALNGSQTLVSQGLRTLELCVDNLQPDFLYDHIQPVRAELFQALWKTLRNQSDNIAHVAFRVLGKFGGGNRRMLKEPQKLKFNDMDSLGPCISIFFPESNTPVTLPVSSVIESALTVLKAAPATAPPNTTQQQTTSSQAPDNTAFYRRQAWLVVQSFLVTMMSCEDSAAVFEQLLSHPSFKTGSPPVTGKTALPTAVDEATKETLENALLGMLVASSVADIKSDVIPFLCHVVRHFTILGVVQQAGPCASKPSSSPQGADVHTIIDAIASVMMLEEKEVCKTGELAIAVMRETASIIMGDLYKALQLPLFEYLVEKLCKCCYERAWFAKAGGCSSIAFLMKTMPLKWIIEHQLTFVNALMFVMMDLTDEVSAGTVDSAKEILEKLIRQCNTQDEKDEEIIAVQKRCFPTLVQHFVREVISSNNVVREQAQYSLTVLSDITGKSVHDIMEPHKGLLEDMMPPKKHLLRHQPVNMQIALMDGNTFCATLKPRLFTMDLTAVAEHKIFFKELLFLCESDDSQLQKLPCYKNVQNFTALRTNALHALAAYHYIPQVRDTIFNFLYKALSSNVPDVQKAGNEALKKFLAGAPPMEPEVVQQASRPLFLLLGDHRALNLQVIKRLSFLMELFPSLFNEKLCDQLMAHLKNLVEVCVNAANQIANAKPAKKMEDVIDICTAIINIFHLIPAASTKLIDPLIQIVLKVEKALMTSSSFRKPLLKFLIRFPSQTVDYFLLHISDSHISRLFVYFLQQQEAKALRGAIEANPLKLVNSTFPGNQVQAEEQAASFQNKLELQFQGILIVRLLVKFNDDWLSHHRVLVGNLIRIWTSESFQERIKKDGVPVHRWREPKLLVKCLLNYVKHRPSEVELLFQLLRVFTHRHIPDFQFLKTFMEEDVAKKYTVEQKRAVFFKFVDIVHDENFPQDLTAKALQYIIIPMFVASFEKGEESGEIDSIIGGPPNPEQDSGENVISVFVSRVIDPENPFKTSDAVRILLLQFSALLVEHASQHIHDVANKKQGTKLRRMMTFAWPCLLPNKQCVDPATKYHGHLLLAHIISKFAIHKRIVLQVFHSLLKAHATEARSVVRQALAILTPAVPTRMEDGNAMMTHWTKKIIVEDGHTLPQLVHMLQLLVRHYKVYYPVRGHLIQHMITAMQKLGFTSSATIEHRRLAVDLANVIIEWEIQRTKDEQPESTEVNVEEKETPGGGVKRSSEESTQEAKRVKSSVQGSSQKDGGQSSQHRAQVEKHHADAVVNFLLRVSCQVNEASATAGSPGEALSKRCVLLLKTALKPGFWQGIDLKLTWLDKLFVTLDQTPGTNFNNVCTGLEILTYLLTVLPRKDMLQLLKPLQRGIVACMTCQNNKVIKAVHTFLAKLMNLFPIESATMTNKYEELEILYSSLGKFIYEGLTTYAKSANQGATAALQGPLMYLKAAFSNSPSYIDRLINPCIRALQKMYKDHIVGSSGDMLITCVDLLKSRLGAMDVEARKLFTPILAQLIDKSPDAKLLKAITKVTEEWVKAKVTQQNQQHLPTLREKAILLCRMMPHYEKRFPEDFELHAQYLELINYVYRDESLLGTELAAKLEPAFLSGLKCAQPQIRSRFMEVFDQSISKKLYERLLYIFCSQNWESMKNHYWIKQCIELLLAAAVCDRQLNLSSTFNKLPSLTSMLKLSAKSEAREVLDNVKKTDGTVATREEPMDTTNDQGTGKCDNDDFLFTKESSESILSTMKDDNFPQDNHFADSSAALRKLAIKHQEFLTQQRKIKSTPFLGALAQLCHSDTQLCHNVWINLFPQLWKLLQDKQQQILAGELSPFMCSGTNCVQLNSHPSVVHTMLESISRCEPKIPIRPSILKYLGKSHNQWHLSTLILEDYVSLCEEYVNPPLLHQQQELIESIYEEDVSDVNPQETLDSLAEMYSLLNEEDMWAGLWLRRARYPETVTAISYESQGFFEQAQSAYEQAMTKARDEHTRAPASAQALPEYKLWKDHWIKCSQELGHWDLLMEFGKSKGNSDPFLVLESAWRVPDWPSMKEALAQVEKGFPDSIAYKHDLYRAYIEICHPEDHLKMREVEKLVETASAQAIRLWKRLPDIISHQHISFLQASQQIVELQEAAHIRGGLQPQTIGRNASLHDMKATIKTWKNRLPMISDNLSHWSDIFLWRHHHYESIINAYDAQHDQTNHSMLGVHASAWSIIHYGQVARKQSLTGVCLDSLSRIHTIPSVPIVDCFQKIRQQVKCYLQMAGTMRKQELQEGLEVIESTNLKYFSKEMTAEFYALKGTFLAQIGRSEDANKAFSQAVQMHDNLIKGWALWGDYLDNIFVKERTMTLGVYAIICYMHACRNPNEAKCRKYLARTIWLLTFDDEKSCLAEALDKYCVGVPAVHWLPWVPQLLTCLTRKEGSKILSLLMQIGRVHAQAVYFPIRTLYLTLKLEHREKYKLEASSVQKANSKQGSVSTPTTPSGPTTPVTPTAAVPGTVNSTSGSQEEKSDSVHAPAAASSTDNAPKTTLPISGSANSPVSDVNADSSTRNTASIASSKPVETVSTSGTTSANTSTAQGSLTSSQSTGEPGSVRVTPSMWLCSRIMHALRELQPTLLAALEGIVDQMVWFRECWHEEVLRQLRQVLTKCYQVAFETRTDVSNAKITPHTMSFVKKLVSTFGVGFEFSTSVSHSFASAASESLARRAHATAQDPMFQKMKEQFTADFDFSTPNSMGLHNLIAKLKKWIKILEAKTKLLSSSFLLEERCRFLSVFSIATADVELPGEFLMPKTNMHSHYYIRIAQFMPRVELVQKHNMSARRLFIRANNGKIYPYLVVNDACLSDNRREERVLQLLRILNLYFEKRKESSKRHLLFTVPRVVAVSPQMRLIEDTPSAVTLKEIMKKHYCKKGIDEDTPVSIYYERLAAVQARGEQSTHQVLRDIFKEIQSTIVPEVVLKEWAQRSYQSSADYWTFRKQFTTQLTLSQFVEFTLHLSRLSPEMLQIVRETGRLTIAYYKFEIDDNKGELDANRPVPFRLTPNISGLISPVGIGGVLTSSMVAAARCLVDPKFSIDSILRAILRDEMIAWHKKKHDKQILSNIQSTSEQIDNEVLISLVNGAVNSIMTRLQNLAEFEGAETKVTTLIGAAMSPDNLCRMDPAWHPWL